MSATPFEGLEQLADCVYEGRAAFFIGAGFSIDSEQNHTARILNRLLARFSAMTQLIGWGKFGRKPLPPDLQSHARDMLNSFKHTFVKHLKIKGGLASKHHSKKVVSAISHQYYEINDWLCNAFAHLLVCLHKINGETYEQAFYKRFSARLHRHENSLLKRIDGQSPRMAPIIFHAWMLDEPQQGGKALFLDAVGFQCRLTMAGNPHHPSYDVAATSYPHLFPRHHVLARMAREGWTNPIFTTNFDMLLEGGLRIAGLDSEMPHQNRNPGRHEDTDLPVPRTTMKSFTVLSDATTFFNQNPNRRIVQLVKIHGCALQYRAISRERVDKPRANSMKRALKNIVFTFRDVQNWRSDAWSRDYLSTILRTRTLVLCCYRGADPVVHNTFRNIYEEIQSRGTATVSAEKEQHPKNASASSENAEENGEDSFDASRQVRPQIPKAFFFGPATSREFHALEILRAASAAQGDRLPDLRDHVHYLKFAYFGDAKDWANIDNQFLWVYHRCMRNRQLESLEEIPSMANSLFGHPCPKQELDTLRQSFWELMEAERKGAEKWVHLKQWDVEPMRVMGWTYFFLAGLLREFALSESKARHGGIHRRHRSYRRWHWYFPARDHQAWTAWATVLELALRRGVLGGKDGFKSANAWHHIWPATTPFPAIYARPEGSAAPRQWIISSLDIPMAPLKRSPTKVFWYLRPEELPWIPAIGKQAVDEGIGDLASQSDPWHVHITRPPDAKRIWEAAVGLDEGQPPILEMTKGWTWK